MLAIQPICLITGQEELGAIGVWARIGHGEKAWEKTDFSAPPHCSKPMAHTCTDCESASAYGLRLQDRNPEMWHPVFSQKKDKWAVSILFMFICLFIYNNDMLLLL